jgi:hypothetical protein
MSLQTFLPVSKPKDLTYIKTRKQNRNVNASHRLPILGADTETSYGDVFLLALSNGDKIEHPNITFEKVAHFLLKYQNHWIFFYNLDYDAGGILKLLPRSILREYITTKRLDFKFEKFHIRYIPNKQLTISKGNHSVSCYDIAQYSNRKGLADAYQNILKRKIPSKHLEIKEERHKITLRCFLRNKKKIREYCIWDCIMTEQLAEFWADTFFKSFNFYCKRWTSSGYLAEKVLIYNDVEVPFFTDSPYCVQDLAWKSFYGGRFELIQRGYIGECYLYDINSAYPYALTHLPDLTDGKWIESQKINPHASLGFFSIRASVPCTEKITPFPFRTKYNTIVYPCGDFETFVTLEELKALGKNSKIKFNILESYQFIANKNCKYPFKEFVENQYQKRLKMKKEEKNLEESIKIILNSIYGKTAQRTNNVMGNLFNPIISSYTTGFARGALYKFVKKYNLENYVVAFATDSVATRKCIPNLNSTSLGQMKLDKSGLDAFFLSNGFYRIGKIWKNRGIGYDTERKIDVEHMDTQISKKGELYITLRTKKTTHIKGGIVRDKIEDIGKIEEYDKKIFLNSDRKRFWFSQLTSLNKKTFCDSAPMPADMIDEIISNNPNSWKGYLEDNYEPESDL